MQSLPIPSSLALYRAGVETTKNTFVAPAEERSPTLWDLVLTSLSSLVTLLELLSSESSIMLKQLAPFVAIVLLDVDGLESCGLEWWTSALSPTLRYFMCNWLLEQALQRTDEGALLRRCRKWLSEWCVGAGQSVSVSLISPAIITAPASREKKSQKLN